jgi:predicted  nucleic acid-binding Zn-ribbon protein/tetrahydromethanopterin S-methyltransferase subunit B
MRKSFVSISALSLALALTGFSFLNGCETSEQQADHAAQKAVETADRDRAQAQDMDDLQKVQQSYDALTNPQSLQNLSRQVRVLVRSRQAQLRLQRITMMVADLREEELATTRTIDDIEQLALQIAAAQVSVDALKAYDPATQGEKLKAQITEIQGSSDKLTWMMPNPTPDNPDAKVALPTLAALQQKIDALNSEIQHNQDDTVAARKLSSAKGDEAENFLRKAEGESGDDQVNDSTRAAEDRRDAALADSKADTMKVTLARLQASLDEAQDQKSSMEGSVKTLEAQMQSQQTRWTSVSDQVQGQKKVQQSLIGASADEAGPVTMWTLSQQLASHIQKAAAVREKIDNDLNAVIPQLNDAITQAGQLRSEWVTDLREKQDDPDAVIWRQAEETLHPAYFNLQLASALLTRASVAAAKTRIDVMIAQMFDGYAVNPADAAAHFKTLVVSASKPIRVAGLTALLDPQRTGVAIPTPFSDLVKADPDQLKQEVDDVNKAFDAAVQKYDPQSGAIDSGPAADGRHNIALSGQAEANRAWAQFADMIGDSEGAANHTKAAEEAEAQIDPSFRLIATAANSGTPKPPAAPGSAQ